jgi:hypothetical protein
MFTILVVVYVFVVGQSLFLLLGIFFPNAVFQNGKVDAFVYRSSEKFVRSKKKKKHTHTKRQKDKNMFAKKLIEQTGTLAARRNLTTLAEWDGTEHPSRSTEPIQLARLGNVSVEIMNADQVDQAAELFTDIWVDGTNPVHKALGTTREEHQPFARKIMRRMYENADTVVVGRDLKTDRLLGFSLNKDMLQPGWTETEKSNMPTIIQRHLKFLDWAQLPMHEPLATKHIWEYVDNEQGEKVPHRREAQLGDLIDGSFFGVRSELEKSGARLGGALLLWGWAFLRHAGYLTCVGITTHWGSMSVAKNALPVRKVYFRDYVEEDGTRLLENLTEPPYCLVAATDLHARTIDILFDASLPGHKQVLEALPHLANRGREWKRQVFGTLSPAEARATQLAAEQQAINAAAEAAGTRVTDDAAVPPQTGEQFVQRTGAQFA